ncbi:stalk domain-containing protein [Paenibacillus sp. DMB5]|uniref:stalk domain-containing protein n=1 Tax=Paenibacillus sp. DMB5 TaxID=1780103 RepID=UPI00076D2BB5|nr:stalk domain-containing protein [Paenibacillus sp. DMB5]KUP24928.1 hypothetical protein AWJ19_03325 [Paenibacillus sp. DMB5]
MKKAIIGLAAGMLIGSAGMAAAATTQTVQAAFAKFTISINGQKQSLKSDPLIYNGTTYLPVREVSNLLGYTLEFDNSSKSIDLSKGGNSAMLSTDNWLSIMDLKDYGITVTGNLNDEMILVYGSNTLKIPLPALKNGIYISNTPSGDIEIDFSEEGTKINLDSLKDAGIIQ